MHYIWLSCKGGRFFASRRFNTYQKTSIDMPAMTALKIVTNGINMWLPESVNLSPSQEKRMLGNEPISV